MQNQLFVSDVGYIGRGGAFCHNLNRMDPVSIAILVVGIVCVLIVNVFICIECCGMMDGCD